MTAIYSSQSSATRSAKHEKAVPIQIVYDPVAKLQYGLSLGYSTSSDFYTHLFSVTA